MSTIYSAVFFPIFPWIFQIAVTAFAIVVGLHLSSIGTPINQVLRMSEDTNCKCTGNASHYTVKYFSYHIHKVSKAFDGKKMNLNGFVLSRWF